MADVLGEFVVKVREIVGDNADILVKLETEEKKLRHNRGGELCYISKNISVEVRREVALRELRKGKSVVEVIKISGLGRDNVEKLKRTLKS